MIFHFKIGNFCFFQIKWIKVSNKLFKQFYNNFSLTPLRLFPEIMAATIDQKDRNKKLARSVELFAIRLYCLHYNHHLSLDDKTFLRKNNHSQTLFMSARMLDFMLIQVVQTIQEFRQGQKNIWTWYLSDFRMIETDNVKPLLTYCFLKI